MSSTQRSSCISSFEPEAARGTQEAQAQAVLDEVGGRIAEAERHLQCLKETAQRSREETLERHLQCLEERLAAEEDAVAAFDAAREFLFLKEDDILSGVCSDCSTTSPTLQSLP